MKFDLADVKPSVTSWIIVGALAMSFILVGKWVFNQYKVEGLTDLFNAV